MERSKISYAVLKAIYPQAELRKWSTAKQLEHIYLFGIDAQFADTGRTSDALALWDKAKQHALMPVTLALPMASKFALEWLRSGLLPGHVLGLPSTFVRFVEYVGY